MKMRISPITLGVVLLSIAACSSRSLPAGPASTPPQDNGPGGPVTTPAPPSDLATSGGGPSCGGCTRRPDGNTSWMCPPGVGESATMVIGAAGGTISLTGQQGKVSGAPFSIDFPPTALASDTTVVVVETSMPPPSGFDDWSPVWQLSPAGTALAAPARLTVPWSNHDGIVDPGLAIYTSDDGVTWTRVHDSYVDAGFNLGSVTRLPTYVFNGAPCS